jgi:hypothetical protein
LPTFFEGLSCPDFIIHRSNPAKRRSQNLLALWCDLAALVVLSAMEHLLRAAVQGLSVTLANKSLFSYFMLN